MRVAILVLAIAGAGTRVLAGAWAQPKGHGLLILKGEAMRADQGFDLDRSLQQLPDEREDDTVSLYGEYGLTDTLTVQGKVESQRGRDAFVDYDGLGQTEIGLRWQAWHDDRTAVSLYAAYALAGEGRNAGYAAPGRGDGDAELRLLAGRSGRVRAFPVFAEAQLARRYRSGLPDEVRLDTAVGLDLSRRWTLMAQSYAGRTDDDGADWINAELSLLRHFGGWDVQAGWRQAVTGRETPAQRGAFFAVWRRF